MLLRYFYDEKLAHASYMVGCQATGEAIIIDPSRNITPYLEAAKKEGVRITGAAETHIHADFVSGGRELAKRGATLYVSDEGGPDWQYQNLESYSHRLLKDKDRFAIGNLVFEVMHTPGHTPESISFLLTDRGADTPMGIFSGDFVFVGDVGRPDLLEKAAGYQGTADQGAREMFRSLQKFKQLPDYLQLWPAHGAGSACGKALGAVPSSTVGYEKRFNWALAYTDEEEFVQALLDGQPEPPKYFAVMKHVNKVGIDLLEDVTDPTELTTEELEKALARGEMVIDTRAAGKFAKKHIEGTINIPFNRSFTNWAGWFVNYEEPIHLLVSEGQLNDVLIALRSIGIDKVKGYMDVERALASSQSIESYEEITPKEAAAKVEAGEVTLIDVRNQTEWDEGHIPQANHMMLGTLLDRYNEIPKDRPVIVQCRSGARSAIGASILQAKGIKKIYNLTGGFNRWSKEVPHLTV
jgi:hydroxyacylglutathione hydrolase